jgi:hypothetical protein
MKELAAERAERAGGCMRGVRPMVAIRGDVSSTDLAQSMSLITVPKKPFNSKNKMTAHQRTTHDTTTHDNTARVSRATVWQQQRGAGRCVPVADGNSYVSSPVWCRMRKIGHPNTILMRPINPNSS